jgi:hypothetical protein
LSPLPQSFHLAALASAGLVTQRRQSRLVIYAANYAAMNGLMAYLTENCCGGVPCTDITPAADRQTLRRHCDPRHHHLSQPRLRHVAQCAGHDPQCGDRTACGGISQDPALARHAGKPDRTGRRRRRVDPRKGTPYEELGLGNADLPRNS